MVLHSNDDDKTSVLYEPPPASKVPNELSSIMERERRSGRSLRPRIGRDSVRSGWGTHLSGTELRGQVSAQDDFFYQISRILQRVVIVRANYKFL